MEVKNLKLFATQGRAILKVLPKEDNQNGIYLAIDQNNDVSKGEIIDIGLMKDKEVFNGEIGDVALYGQYSGVSYTIDSIEYRIINISDIIAILK